jgi:ATP-dependent exoDNAse (exonuclease V) beta subunit
MVARFLASPTGEAFAAALAAGREVRREVAFHARIRFPEGARVGGFDSLLVKGSVDLWLGDEAGRVVIYDHKTNSPKSRWRDPQALVTHYAPQLRLYALAAERVLSREVGGAALLLLDPAWEALGVPVEAAVDVGGPALEATRRLAHTFATAVLAYRA